MKFVPALPSLLALVIALPTRASNPGDQAIVVYNRRLLQSKALAEYYAARRQVPANQIFGFDLPTTEEISRAEFRDSLQSPLAKAIQRSQLWRLETQKISLGNNQPAQPVRRVVSSKIRYAVLCYGVPLRILKDPNLQEKGAEHLRPELRRNEAAVDNELALLPALEQKPPLAGPLRNPVFAVTNAALLDPTNSVLLVSRLDGPTPEIARGLVDKALDAESEGLWGRAYFDLRNTTDPAFKPGDDWIRNAAEITRRLGYETIMDESPGVFAEGFPMSQIALYIGWYSENVSGPFTQPAVEFMPGAFAYHLHSFSAASLRNTNHNWVAPLLAKGVTITMGCVDEPYLAGTPDVGVFTARLLYYGFTFGEAAYAAQPVLSWQTTVVGDPLYRPAAINPDQFHRQLEQRHSKFLEWSNLRWVNLNLANGKPISEWVTFLELLGATKQSAVLTEKLGDLYAAQGKPSSAAYEYTQALKLAPSPQQRIRLLLGLGEKLPPLGRESEAYAIYQRLLDEFPQYPDRSTIYRKLLPLAQKLNQPADAEKYESELKRLAPPGKP